MVRCDLCGASPSGTDADAVADAVASPSGSDAEAHRDASPTGANAHAGDADATVPLSWVVSVEAGRTRTYCKACAREHLRSIEAKLDSKWW